MLSLVSGFQRTWRPSNYIWQSTMLLLVVSHHVGNPLLLLWACIPQYHRQRTTGTYWPGALSSTSRMVTKSLADIVDEPLQASEAGDRRFRRHAGDFRRCWPLRGLSNAHRSYYRCASLASTATSESGHQMSKLVSGLVSHKKTTFNLAINPCGPKGEEAAKWLAIVRLLGLHTLRTFPKPADRRSQA